MKLRNRTAHKNLAGKFKFILNRFFIFFVVATLMAMALMVWMPLRLPASSVRFDVPSGSSLTGVHSSLQKAKIPVNSFVLRMVLWATGKARYVQPGTYELKEGVNTWQLANMLTTGQVIPETVTFTEGWTFRQMRDALNANTNLRHDSEKLSDKEILDQLFIDEKSPEGLFFPDTYHFRRNASDMEILRQAHRAQKRILEELWLTRDEGNLPLSTPYEALILASIVEKETGREEDRPSVASVFINRLNAKLPLQSDPTVIYGMGNAFDGNLRKADLQRVSVYNTYVLPGLPPTPIAMAGRQSLLAVLNPIHTKFFYFVARGDGTSVFSATLGEHNRAVGIYQKNKIRHTQK